MKITIIPKNSDAEWFKYHLARYGEVNFCGDEANFQSPQLSASSLKQLHDSDLVIYRRMRAKEWYPTDNPFLCFEWTPFRHPLTAWNYYIDGEFFDRGTAVEQFNNLNYSSRLDCEKAGRRLCKLYTSAIEKNTLGLMNEYVLERSRYPVLIVLQVPDDDVLHFCSDYGGNSNNDPHEAIIGFAESYFGDQADLFIKAHPASPNISTAGLAAIRKARIIDPFTPILPLLKLSKIVITINSSCATEALILGTPVITFGKSVVGDLKFTYSKINPPNSLSPRMTPAWEQDGLSFLGFMSTIYGCWYPSPELLFSKLENVIQPLRYINQSKQ